MGKFRQRKYIEARKTLKGLMQVRAMPCMLWSLPQSWAPAAGLSTAEWVHELPPPLQGVLCWDPCLTDAP